MDTKLVSVVERSKDSKLSADMNVSTTWVGQQSCPGSSPKDSTPCPLMSAGCYAEIGHSGFNTFRLNRNGRNADLPVDDLRKVMAEAEAEQIVTKLSGTRQLRVHVVGDCSTPESAALIGSAMVKHEAKHGKTAWTYTHAWRDVAREDWNGANVLASCHTMADVREARKRGYAASIIVDKHPSNKVRVIDGERILPCPAQFKRADGSRVTTCEHCSFCKRPEWLLQHGLSVGFQPDAGSERKVIPLAVTK